VYSREELADHFRALGVAAGDTIMLHASVRAVGAVAGGPDQVHLALKDALTGEGTLMMLAGCPRYYDEVGRGNLSAEEEREILQKLPAFNPLTARADRENGILVEFLRSYPGAHVNDHVIRFVTWGKHATSLTTEPPWMYAFGRGSALERLVELDGKILLLGSDHDAVTFLHYAEHIVDIPDKRVVRFKVPVDVNGNRVWQDCEEFDSNHGAHASWPDRYFAKITDRYLELAGNRGGRVGNAESFLMSARGLLEFALRDMDRTARGRPSESTTP
jgi:aminoglycoside 3-N-acetyltransferase